MLGSELKSNGKAERKLDMDLPANRRRVVDMDDTDELIVLLCTHIGIIMEDASVVALTIGALTSNERLDAITKLHDAIRVTERLIEAASVVNR